MNQIETLIADIRNKLTPFWTLTSRIKEMDTRYVKKISLAKMADYNKENIIQALEQIAELSQVPITGNEQVLAEIADYMLKYLRKGNIDAEGFREMARHRNNILLAVEGKHTPIQVPVLKWRKIDRTAKGSDIVGRNETVMGDAAMAGTCVESTASITGYIVKSGKDWIPVTHYIPIQDLLQLEKE